MIMVDPRRPGSLSLVVRLFVFLRLADPSMYLDGSREKIVAWVREGLSDRVIAERVRVSPSTVRYWRERNGIARPPKNAELPRPQSAEE